MEMFVPSDYLYVHIDYSLLLNKVWDNMELTANYLIKIYVSKQARVQNVRLSIDNDGVLRSTSKLTL